MGKKILIIDDDPGFRELMFEILKSNLDDVQIDQAQDAAEAEKMVKQLNIYDLILLDYRMPNGFNGIDFLSQTGNLLEETDVIMITGEGNEEVAAKAFKNGVTDYFIKGPGLLSKILEKVIDILARQDSHETWKSTNPNSAHSGIEMIKKYQEELNRLDTNAALKGESMLLEFREMEEFNKFSRLVKFLNGVKIKETKILDNKYILMLNLSPTRFERISSI